MSTISLLLNPSVATKRRTRADAAIRAVLDAGGHEAVDVRPSGIDMIPGAVREVCRESATRLLLAGGDGLLHHALPALVGSGLDIGIVPVGTGNDFARALDLPTDVAAAVDAALRPTTPLDAIAVTAGPSPSAGPGEPDGYAASVVTGGFSGRVNERANGLRFPRGQQKYTIATLLELPRLRPVPLELTVDGTTHELESSLFAVANTRFFGGGMAICPDADPTDGLLDVTVVGPTSRFELARVLPMVFDGRHVGHRSVTCYRGASVTVTTPARLWADGEPLGVAPGGPVTLAAMPRALKVAGTLERS